MTMWQIVTSLFLIHHFEIYAVRLNYVRVLHNISLVMSSANSILINGTCDECLCAALLNNTTSISSFNCFYENKTCEMFTLSLVNGSYSFIFHWESSFYVLQLPTDETTSATASVIPRATSSPSSTATSVTSTIATTTAQICFTAPFPRPSNSWLFVGNMSTSRCYHTATLLSEDSSVFIAGGSNSVALATTERYLPTTGCFQRTGNMLRARMYHTADQLSVLSGSVLLAGGYNGASLRYADLFNPFTDNVTTITMTSGRWLHTSILWKTSNLVLIGGLDVNTLNTADKLNITSLSFTENPSNTMISGRHYHTSTQLENTSDIFLIVGGMIIYSPLASAELYNGSSNSFISLTAAMPTTRYQHTATYIPPPIHQVLITGGEPLAQTLHTVLVFDVATMLFTTLTNNMLSVRRSHTATLLSTGKVLLVGGFNGSVALSSCELIDPTNKNYSSASAASIHIGRYYHTATLIPSSGNVTVLICGGKDTNGTVLNSCELYFV